jgi:hypothetical protein
MLAHGPRSPSDGAGDVGGQGLSGALVDDLQDLDPAPAAGLSEQDVHGPNDVGPDGTVFEPDTLVILAR